MLLELIKKRSRDNQRCNKTSKPRILRTTNMLFQRSTTTCSSNNQSSNSRSTPILAVSDAMAEATRDVRAMLRHQATLRVNFTIASLAVSITVNNAMAHMVILIL